MTPRAKRELFVVTILGTLLIGIGMYSISYARAAVRDDLRKQDITNLKRALEQYYNVHESYIAPPTGLNRCTVSSDNTSWFFGNNSPLLQGQFIDALPHDVREGRGFAYSYCVTDTIQAGATAFYLEAILESQTPEGVFFDQDEQRKFDYRVLSEHDTLRYRVCGGTEQQCKIESL